MQKKIKILLIFITGLVLLNFSSDNKSKSDKNSINFYGTITTNSGNQYKVDNITISGGYNDIPIYAKPLNKMDDPKIDTTRLNLQNIQAIVRPVTRHPEIFKFNHRDYIEIKVIWKDAAREPKSYIIERNKQILCDEIDGAKPKEIALETISKLQIDGFKHKTDETCKEQIVSTEAYNKISNQIKSINDAAAKVTDNELKKTLLANIEELKKQLTELIQ